MENGLVEKRLEEHTNVAMLVQKDPKIKSQIRDFAQAIISAYKSGGKLIVMGNGGSAADSQHIAAEFLGKYLKDRRALPAIALTVNTSALTAIGNDYGFEKVFSRQLEAWLKKEDVVLGISTSGNSPNIVEALKYAKSKNVFTAALVGSKPCKLDSVASISIKVPSPDTPRIQEMHILIAHIVCELVEDTLVEKGII